jgi:hypothetical protein
MSEKGRHTLRPAYKYAIIISVLVVAFVASTLLAIDVAVNLSVPVQNSNSQLDEWVKSLQGKYSLYYGDFRPSGNLVKIDTISQFENALSDHKMSEAYYEWTQLAFPFTIDFGKIWFVDEGTTYYIPTSW